MKRVAGPRNQIHPTSQCVSVAGLAAGRRPPEPLLREIVAKADGVPLFVEELTKAVLESGLLRETADGYAHGGPPPPLAIPSTLQDSLMARLDRLAPVKEVAQVGALIGREFSREILAAVADLPDERLADAMAQLIAAGLVFARGVPPEVTYSFKHALVQDAAYQSLLKSRRHQLHARAAEVLETRFPRHPRNGARAGGPPPHRSGHCRSRSPVVAEGRPTGVAVRRLPRGGGTPTPRHRGDRCGARHARARAP